MNPKATDLDPKQKEAYERVMGHTAAAQPTVSSSPQPSVVAKPQAQVVTAKKKGGLSIVLVVIAIVLFFIVYTVIWTMIFKLKIPFLPF